MHRYRRNRLATGSSKKVTGCNSPRLAVTFPTDDWALIEWWAKRQEKSAAQVVRDAVWAYFRPMRDNPTLKDNPSIVKAK